MNRVDLIVAPDLAQHGVYYFAERPIAVFLYTLWFAPTLTSRRFPMYIPYAC
jgi:hypothetical protein